MCSVYKLNKQGDNKQPCHIPFSIFNQSVVPYRKQQLETCMVQVSPETGKTVWYSHLFKSFTVCYGFSIVNETELDIFLEFPCFLYDPANVGNLISGSSAFFKPSLNIWKFLVCVMLKSSMQGFEHKLISMGYDCNCPVV